MNNLRTLLRRFGSDQRGVFAVIFGIVAVVLVALSGAVVDYVSLQNARGTAQEALDAATLALHVEIDSQTPAQLEILAESLLNERLSVLSVTADVERVLIDTSEGTLFIEARFGITTTFLSLVGIPQMFSRVSAEVTSKSVNIEVALVLDSTGSMSGTKLAALKSSANLLVDELMPDLINPDIKIGVVPFNRYVNIGMANRNEPGLDIEADYDWTPSGQNCYNTYPNSTYQCDSNWESYSCTKDGEPSTCWHWVYTNCTGSYGEPVQVCVPYSTRQFRWYGCMGSRHIAPLDTQDLAYNTDPVPGIIRHWNSCNVAPLTELSSTKTDVQNGIAAMNAQDNTYIPTGLMWGWRLLSPQTPFTAEPYDDENKKVLILMTDGMNTVSPSLAWTFHEQNTHRVHRGSDTAEANLKTQQICANIATEDIVIYTIAFEVTDPDILAVLSGCAQNGGSYYDAANSAQLQQAFEDIADDLNSLRISR